MAFKDPLVQSAFQCRWVKERREAWIRDHGPCRKCGSDKSLTVVKRYRTVKTVKVFSWSEENRKEVLKKCWVLCRTCKVKHYSDLFRKTYTGTNKTFSPSELTATKVWMIRGRLLGRESVRAISRDFGITHHAILDIKNGKTWSWLKGGRRKVHGVNRR